MCVVSVRAGIQDHLFYALLARPALSVDHQQFARAGFPCTPIYDNRLHYHRAGPFQRVSFISMDDPDDPSTFFGNSGIVRFERQDAVKTACQLAGRDLVTKLTHKLKDDLEVRLPE